MSETTTFPDTCVLLLSGIPAVGKSELGSHLAQKHGCAHYDLEHHPEGWPLPEFKAVWDASRVAFLRALADKHTRVALDWGFPPSARGLVDELQSGGVASSGLAVT